jgi:hypothetical protein
MANLHLWFGWRSLLLALVEKSAKLGFSISGGERSNKLASFLASRSN